MQLVGLDGWIGGSPKPEQMQRFIQPTNDTALGPPVEIKSAPRSKPRHSALRTPHSASEEPGRRWYPVIDYSRCTNCMECIDFCLFGVYGVDKVETILVEQPDNCRKGCPACSRVCPENAIIFPQHKTPTIAGAPVVAGSLKIDLSKLFGAPETGESAEQAAIRERDEQLVLAGRAGRRRRRRPAQAARSQGRRAEGRAGLADRRAGQLLDVTTSCGLCSLLFLRLLLRLSPAGVGIAAGFGRALGGGELGRLELRP